MCQSRVIGVPQQRVLADPVIRALWVHDHKAWVNTLTIEPSWLGEVYQGQQDPSNAAMQKYMTNLIVMMTIFALKCLWPVACILHTKTTSISVHDSMVLWPILAFA